MSRELKFRAWDTINNYFAKYPQFIFIGMNGKTYEDDTGAHCIMVSEMENQSTYIISQYTGLKDSDGKDIYEDDILKVEAYELSGSSKRIGKVIFANGTFGMTNCLFNFAGNEFLRPLCDLIGHPSVTFKIIGNIYQNSEFLEIKQ